MALLTQRNYLPLFLAHTLGVFNDNVFKSALTMLVTYKLAAGYGLNAGMLVSLGGGIFILPYVLFSGFAGQLADKFEKTTLIRLVKVVEIAIVGTGIFALHAEHLWSLMLLLFLMGTHSAFFGPVKYGILPQTLPKNQLVAANGLFEGSTFMSILFGTMYGGALILHEHGVWIVGATCLSVALFGLISSLLVPSSPGVDPHLKLNRNILAESWNVIQQANQGPGILSALLFISWFWLVGAVLLSLIPVYGAQIMHGDELVTTCLLSFFSVGIAIGSVMCQKLLKDQITLHYVPIASLWISIAGFGILLLTPLLPAPVGELRTIGELVTYPIFWPIIACFILLAMAGGVFTVPLYAYVQAVGRAAIKSRIIAANNVLNAIFMVAGALFSSVLLGVGVSLTGVIGILMAANLFVALFSTSMLSHHSKQKLLQMVLRPLFRVDVKGLHNTRNLPKRLVVICNHQSFLDAALLAIFLPIRPMFAIDTDRAQQWWIKPFLNFVRAIPLSPANPYAVRNLIKTVRNDEQVMIFPEGRLSQTGMLMKVYDGTGMIAANGEADILPVILDGLQFSKYTTHKNVVPKRWFPKVTITVLPVEKLDIAPGLRGRTRRSVAGQKLQRILVNAHYAAAETDRTQFSQLVHSGDLYGMKSVILKDFNVNLPSLRYKDLVARSLMLGGVLQRMGYAPRYGEHHNAVGLLLPNANAAVATFFALQAVHAVPAMLNFSAGADAVSSACKTAKVRHVLTARSFVEKGKLQNLIDRLEKDGLEIVYLEDIRAKLTLLDKLKVVAAGINPHWFYHELQGEPNRACAILFTSGTEGKPKGVVLSHQNFLSNIAMVRSVVDFNPKDTLLNALPMFHSFGLMGGTLLPIFGGVPTVLYPSPLHYRIVPEMVYNHNATVMFATDTFLTGYARYANPYDFYRMRYVFAGAEKVRPETRKLWFEKFGIRIMEGYGATETSPVLAVNTPMGFREGTVGKLLPGIEYKLESVPGIEGGGNLTVRGPNVMLGYIRESVPGKLEPPVAHGEAGWYETGDMVHVDEHRFVTILGRLKRFAKIGGEMVSLPAVEGLASGCWPHAETAVVAMPDARKGEQLVMFTTQEKASKDDFRKHARAHGASELMLPRHLVSIDKLPTLATGKVNYPKLMEMAEDIV